MPIAQSDLEAWEARGAAIRKAGGGFLNNPFIREIVSAEVVFRSEYRLLWRRVAISDVFTLNTRTVPPVWMPGEPLP